MHWLRAQRRSGGPALSDDSQSSRFAEVRGKNFSKTKSSPETFSKDRIKSDNKQNRKFEVSLFNVTRPSGVFGASTRFMDFTGIWSQKSYLLDLRIENEQQQNVSDIKQQYSPKKISLWGSVRSATCYTDFRSISTQKV